MKRDPIFPAMKRRIRPANGANITGRRIGRLIEFLTDKYGLKAIPKSVLVQM